MALRVTVWTLQGFLVMFYVGAGYAKLTESRDLLAFMMIWPAWVSPNQTAGVGVAEICLAVVAALPLFSRSLWGGAMVGAIAVLTTYATGMLVFFTVSENWFIAALNLVLAMSGGCVLLGHRFVRSRASR